jgi:hypothetical protein
LNIEHRTSNIEGKRNDDPTSLGSYEGQDEEFPNDERGPTADWGSGIGDVKRWRSFERPTLNIEGKRD